MKISTFNTSRWNVPQMYYLLHCVLVWRGFIVNIKAGDRIRTHYSATWLFDNLISSCKICVLNKTKWFLFDLSADISLLYSIYLMQWVKKNTRLSFIFLETKLSCCIHWWGKQKYQITNVGMKSKIVTFATKWTKLNIKYHNKFKTVLTNSNCKLFLGLERKHKHETYTLPRLC